MSNISKFILALIVGFVFSSCSSVQEKRSQSLSRAVYAENSALTSGRFDLAAQYGKQAERLLKPPKKPVAVKPLDIQGKRFLTLPGEFNGTPTLVFGTPEADKALKADPKTEKQVKEEQKTLGKVEKEETKIIAQVQKEEAKEKSSGSSFFHLGFFGKLILASPLFLLLVFGVLCIFFPALLPLLFNLVSDIREGINFLLSLAAEGVERIRNNRK